MRPPLWLNVEGTGRDVTVSLARCRNCGKVKATSDPCGLDHLKAVIEFGDFLRERDAEPPDTAHPTARQGSDPSATKETP